MGACVRRSSVIISVLVAALLCGAAMAAPRVVALDYCADQFVLALADRMQIAALSTDAESERSNMRQAAQGLPQIPATLEAALAVRPDVVVRAWGGGLGLDQALSRFGVRTVTLEYVDGLAGVRANVHRVAAAVGQPERGAALVAVMDQRLAAVAAQVALLPPGRRPLALYITPGGATSGPHTLLHDLMTAAGLRNQAALEPASGWTKINLERLVTAPPDVVVAGFFDLEFLKTDVWRLGRHQVVRDFLQSRPVAFVPARHLACATWHVVDAVETIFAQLVAARLMTAQTGEKP